MSGYEKKSIPSSDQLSVWHGIAEEQIGYLEQMVKFYRPIQTSVVEPLLGAIKSLEDFQDLCREAAGQ